MADGNQIDLSAGLAPKPASGIDLSAGLVPTPAAAQPGAMQAHKGGQIFTADNPPPPPSRETQVAGEQAGMHAAVAGIPGGEAALGFTKGLYQTGIGIDKLLAQGLGKLGFTGEEQ